AARFPYSVLERISPPALPEHIENAMNKILTQYRNDNDSVRAIRDAIEERREKGYKYVETQAYFLNSIEKAYILLLLQVAQPAESGAMSEKVRAQQNLPFVAEELAKMYADIHCAHLLTRRESNTTHDEKVEHYRGFVRGTLTAYLLNRLKEKSLIPANTRFD